jgi:DNA-directed RNA polymerase specialized sigma subunit
VDDDSGEEHDAWEAVADKDTLQIVSYICAKMDEDWVLDCLSKRNKYIYEKCVIDGVSQSAVAKELGLTQSSVSRRLIKILHPKNNVCAEKDYPIILKNFSKF